MRFGSASIKVVAILLVAVFMLWGCENSAIVTERDERSLSVTESLQTVSDAFSQVSQHLQDGTLHLTIYYLNFNILTRASLNTEDVINDSLTETIAVKNDTLQMYRELFNSLQPNVLIPYKNNTGHDVRLCYVFETPEDGAILTVGFSRTVLDWGSMDIYDSVLVNDFEVEYDDVFYEIIRPFITEDMQDTFDACFDYQIG